MDAKERMRIRSARRYRERADAGLCRRCGNIPPIEGKTRCAACAAEDCRIGRECNKRTDKGKNYYRKNTDRYRNWYYQRRYRISLVEYQRLLDNQGGKCAICGGIPKNGRRLDVDHDHATGTLRGLLCASCNTAIGHLREKKSFFLKALEYLGHTL